MSWRGLEGWPCSLRAHFSRFVTLDGLQLPAHGAPDAEWGRGFQLRRGRQREAKCSSDVHNLAYWDGRLPVSPWQAFGSKRPRSMQLWKVNCKPYLTSGRRLWRRVISFFSAQLRSLSPAGQAVIRLSLFCHQSVIGPSFIRNHSGFIETRRSPALAGNASQNCCCEPVDMDLATECANLYGG